MTNLDVVSLWKNKKTKEIRLQKDFGVGSPAWDHWALILYPIKRNVSPIRIELEQSEDSVSRCGTWKSLDW